MGKIKFHHFWPSLEKFFLANLEKFRSWPSLEKVFPTSTLRQQVQQCALLGAIARYINIIYTRCGQAVSKEGHIENFVAIYRGAHVLHSSASAIIYVSKYELMITSLSLCIVIFHIDNVAVHIVEIKSRILI